MTIKQQGGIFGRNPSFNDVKSETVETNILDVDNIRVDGNTISTTDTDGNLSLSPNGSGITQVNKIGVNTSSVLDAGLVSIAQGSLYYFGPAITIQDNNPTVGGSYIRFNNEGGTEIGYVRRNGSNNISLGVGDGGGIDFSATSGTGTSELFDDYEEGTWTPSPSRFVGGGITATYNTQAGYYTKVGNLVTCSFALDIASISAQGSSLTFMAGLPYAPARSYYDSGVTTNNTAFATVDVVSMIAHSDSRFYFRQSGNTASNSSAAWVAGALSGTITYMTS